LDSAEAILQLRDMVEHVVFLHDEPLKRVGGEVEAACDVGEVRFYRKLPPEEVAELADKYADGVSAPYFQRYVAPNNPDRPVDLAIIELRDVRGATLPPEQTPRRVMSGWVANFDAGAT
jgi:hypothetical protein